MKPSVLFFIIVSFFQSTHQLSAQFAALPFLMPPRSMLSHGLGEQGAASLNCADALQYNPANLAFLRTPTISFFRDPDYFFGMTFPLTSVSASFELSNVGTFGLEYLHHDLGEFPIYDEYGPIPGSRIQSYEASYSVAFGHLISQQWSYGLQVRYVRSTLSAAGSTLAGWSSTAENVFVTTGLSYVPVQFDGRLRAGFSLINFGTPVSYADASNGDPPPSQLRLGASFAPLQTEWYSVLLYIETSKDIAKLVDHEGQSSFKSLFNDWDDLPRDMSLSTGVAFRWEPINLGNHFSIFQEMYVGHLVEGPLAGNRSQFMHAARVGVEWNGISISAGYADTWFSLRPRITSFLNSRDFPGETFQFTLQSPGDIFNREPGDDHPTTRLNSIIVSAGVGQVYRIGRFHRLGSGDPASFSFADDNVYGFESAFYFTGSDALVTRAEYAPIRFDFVDEYQGQELRYTAYRFDTYSLVSLYRKHPLENIEPFFCQGGFGVIRFNPFLAGGLPGNFGRPAPRYFYQTTLEAGVGATVALGEGVILLPHVDFKCMLMEAEVSNHELAGWNQWTFSLAIGHGFE